MEQSDRPADVTWWYCPECVAHRDANWHGLSHALASVGIERGLTVPEAAWEYFQQFHRRGHV